MTVEARGEFAGLGIDIVDVANIAVVDLLVVVVLDLHHLVARRKGPAETLHLAVDSGVQRRLEFDIQRAGADTTAVHRTKYLDVANGIEAEPFGDPRLHQFDDARHGGFGVVRLHEIEVALGSRRAEIGDRALIYSMGAGDDAALRCLPENFSETHHRHRAG